jgi:hypothetical protein
MEDDVFLELDEHDEPTAPPPQKPNTWRLVARYYANFKPNTLSMFNHFVEDVWRLLIRPKHIYFPEPFCCYFSSNLCVLNTTNTD